LYQKFAYKTSNYEKVAYGISVELLPMPELLLHSYMCLLNYCSLLVCGLCMITFSSDSINIVGALIIYLSFMISIKYCALKVELKLKLRGRIETGV